MLGFLVGVGDFDWSGVFLVEFGIPVGVDIMVWSWGFHRLELGILGWL